LKSSHDAGQPGSGFHWRYGDGSWDAE